MLLAPSFRTRSYHLGLCRHLCHRLDPDQIQGRARIRGLRNLARDILHSIPWLYRFWAQSPPDLFRLHLASDFHLQKGFSRQSILICIFATSPARTLRPCLDHDLCRRLCLCHCRRLDQSCHPDLDFRILASQILCCDLFPCRFWARLLQGPFHLHLAFEIHLHLFFRAESSTSPLTICPLWDLIFKGSSKSGQNSNITSHM